MLTFRNMREMTKDEIKVFCEKAEKSAVPCIQKKNGRNCWKHFLVQKKRDSLSLYWYIKKIC